jgi:hypothetical protein
MDTYIPSTAHLAAADFTFLGILPDFTHKWVRRIVNEVGREVNTPEDKEDVTEKLRNLWMRVQGNPIMQRGGLGGTIQGPLQNVLLLYRSTLRGPGRRPSNQDGTRIGSDPA